MKNYLKIIILFAASSALFSSSASAQWQPPQTMLVTSPEPGDPPRVQARMLGEQQAAQRSLSLPRDGVALLVTLDCSTCRRVMETLRADPRATILIRAHARHVAAWKRAAPTRARVIAVNTDALDAHWFALGTTSVPTVLLIRSGVIVGVSESTPNARSPLP